MINIFKYYLLFISSTSYKSFWTLYIHIPPSSFRSISTLTLLCVSQYSPDFARLLHRPPFFFSPLHRTLSTVWTSVSAAVADDDPCPITWFVTTCETNVASSAGDDGIQQIWIASEINVCCDLLPPLTRLTRFVIFSCPFLIFSFKASSILSLSANDDDDAIWLICGWFVVDVCMYVTLSIYKL